MTKRAGNTTGKLGRRVQQKRSEVQLAMAKRREASDAAWATRHPSLAATERAIGRANRKRIGTWDHKREGTPETHDHASRTHQGALAQLFMNGTITADQLEHSAQIANVHRSIASDVTVTVASLEARVDNQGRGVMPAEGIMRVRMHRAYTIWRERIWAPKQMVIDMIVSEVGYTVAARSYGVHNRKARRLLLQAIDLWPNCVEQAFGEVDRDTVMLLNAA